MNTKNRTIYVIAVTVLFIAVMSYIEKVLQPGYWMKSGAKVILIAGSLALYRFLTKETWKEILFFYQLKNGKPLLIFMAITYVIVITAFLLCRNYIDLQTLRVSLMSKEKLNEQNCLFVFGYIMLVNSFLEEAFLEGSFTILCRRAVIE